MSEQSSESDTSDMKMNIIQSEQTESSESEMSIIPVFNYNREPKTFQYTLANTNQFTGTLHWQIDIQSEYYNTACDQVASKFNLDRDNLYICCSGSGVSIKNTRF